jgi:hypothetical protein
MKWWDKVMTWWEASDEGGCWLPPVPTSLEIPILGWDAMDGVKEVKFPIEGHGKYREIRLLRDFWMVWVDHEPRNFLG